MTTVYKFKSGYTKNGVATAPSSAPTITIVDSSDNVLVNAQATTALANLAGTYLYSYSGADNLDLVGLFKTTDATMDAQDLFATPDILSLVMKAASYVAPDNAGITTIDGIVDSILADTNELQTNQGNWLTADGFSTHSAADVWAVASRSLTTFGTLIADVWAYATRTLSAFAFTPTPSNAAELTAIDGIVDSILADTNELQTNQGNWLTAEGFSTHSAADVWAVASRSLSAFAFTPTPSNAADVTAIKAKTDQFIFTVANQVDANALTGGGAPTVEQIDTQLSSTHGVGLWVFSFGSGSVNYTPDRATDPSGNPLDGVDTWVGTSATDPTIGIQARAYTNALGLIASPFMLDPGTYYVWRQHASYTFTNPETVVVR